MGTLNERTWPRIVGYRVYNRPASGIFADKHAHKKDSDRISSRKHGFHRKNRTCGATIM
jgi:hypothetical protein